jgi:hypothetical protein
MGFVLLDVFRHSKLSFSCIQVTGRHSDFVMLLSEFLCRVELPHVLNILMSL